MAEVVPVPAASVIILRDDPLEVLMILRHEKSSFVPSAWVFPGGAVDGDETMIAAAIRETFEETGIRLNGELVATSRWITPAGLPKRFDTCFFLAVVPRHTPITLQEAEAVEHIWISPADALERHRKSELSMVFPTIRNLEEIAGATSASKLIESRRGADIKAVQPVMVVEGGKRKFELP